MFTEKEMSDALKWLFDLFQPEDYEAYDEEEVGCAALCLPEVCMALRDKAETAYEYVVKTNIDRGFEYRGKELFMQRACLIYSDIEIGIYDMTDTSYNRELWLLEDMSFALVHNVSMVIKSGDFYYATEYTREEVQAELVRLFEEQYDLELDEEVEIRSYTTTDEDGNTSTVYYEYRILNVTLTNYGLGNVIASSRLTAEQWERYKVLLETLGNRSYLFGEDVSSAPGGGGEYTDYDIPGEALTDTAFANMVREAEKYLGYPYVWGGSSPSTSFDCSGFVSWVINNCGNGWSVGRQTANGLKNLCDIIPPSEAKPGDLIFFQGTYNTSGASHVGIYVGNGMMIHCGDPISYASIETNYWQQHFYCFGRIP